MQFEQEGIRIFETLQIRYYGLIIVVAMLVAAFVAARLAKRDGRDPEHIWGALTWAIIPGIILARLWFVFTPPVSITAGCATPSTADVCRDTAYFLQNFFDPQNGAIAIWSGGLSIFGAVIGGLIGVYLYLSPLHNRIARFFSFIFSFWRFYAIILGAIGIVLGLSNQTTGLLVIGIILVAIGVLAFIPWVKKNIFSAPPDERVFPDQGLPIGPWLDIAAVAVPLGQAIGRWANWVNQELYGSVTTLPWGIQIDSAHRVSPYTSTIDFPVAETLFHPLFLYESLLSILAFILLLNLFLRFRKRLIPGDIFLIYIIQYAVVRFLLETLRVDVAIVGGVNTSQAVTAVAGILALLIFLYRHRPGAVVPVRQPDPQPQAVEKQSI